MARDWSYMPVDIAASMALKLETFEDFIRFSAVCKSWNRASSMIKSQWKPSLSTPWLLLSENTIDNPNCVRKLYNPSSNKFYQLNLPQTFGKRCWGSAYGWIAMVHRDIFKVELFNPITKDRIPFPSFEAMFNAYVGQITWEVKNCNLFEQFFYIYLKRLIVIKVSQGDHHEFVIMVLYDWNKYAAFAKHGDETWTSVMLKTNGRMWDAIVMGDNVFAVYDDGSIVYWNVKEFQCGEIVKPIDYCPPFNPDTFEVLNESEKGLYLVQSGDNFLMVLRYMEDSTDRPDSEGKCDDEFSYETIDFEVFILDKNRKSWEEIEDMGNVALFVGENYSMSVSSTLDKGLRRSCIYFTDDLASCRLHDPQVAGLDMGKWDTKSDDTWPLYDGDDICPSVTPPICWRLL